MLRALAFIGYTVFFLTLGVLSAWYIAGESAEHMDSMTQSQE